MLVRLVTFGVLGVVRARVPVRLPLLDGPDSKLTLRVDVGFKGFPDFR